MVVAKVVKDSPDPLRLGGIGNKVGEEIEKRTGIETRTTVLGHVQRGGSPTPYDRILGTRFGVEAVRQVVAGNFGTMVALRGADIVSVPILEAVGKLRKVDPDGDLVKIAREVGTSFGD
jgi:6-phosphofructokinase 1